MSADANQYLARISHLHSSKDRQSLVGTVTGTKLALITGNLLSEAAAECRYTQNEPSMDGYDRFQFLIELSDQTNPQKENINHHNII